MPRYFAQLNNQGVVERVIVADNLEWCVGHLGGEWVETFMNHEEKNYAGVGYKYDSTKKTFIGKKPFESWELNEKSQWEAPVKRPTDGDPMWDEDKKVWVNRDKK